MKVVILAATEQEALSYARAAGVATKDMLIPRGPQSIEGLRLESTDLIAQFYSFINHPKRAEITEALRCCMARTAGEKPQWVSVGQ